MEIREQQGKSTRKWENKEFYERGVVDVKS